METHTYVEDGKLVLKMDKTLNPAQPDPEPPVEEPEEPEDQYLPNGRPKKEKKNHRKIL